jgi:hypothetical protein
VLLPICRKPVTGTVYNIIHNMTIKQLTKLVLGVEKACYYYGDRLSLLLTLEDIINNRLIRIIFGTGAHPSAHSKNDASFCPPFRLCAVTV